jgi:flavodoxin
MKTLVVYYSLSGRTKKAAIEKAEKEGADLLEVRKKKPYSVFSAYIFGARAAMTQKTVEIEEPNCDFAEYDKIILAAPIWGGSPAPPINSIIQMLPAGKDVEFLLTSGGGDSSKSAAKTKELVTKKGCNVVGYTDIKGVK